MGAFRLTTLIGELFDELFTFVQVQLKHVYAILQHYLVGTMISNCFLAPLSLREADHIKIHDGIEDIMVSFVC